MKNLGFWNRFGKSPLGDGANACFSRRRPPVWNSRPRLSVWNTSAHNCDNGPASPPLIDPTQHSGLSTQDSALQSPSTVHRPPSTTILIHGYGNPLRGDDGLGPAVVDVLKERLGDVEGVVFQTSHQLTPELAESMAEADSVLLIDAAAQGEAGFIRLDQVQPSATHPGATHHHCTPQALLELCGELYGRAPRLFVASVVGADFSYREGLSLAARNALPLLVERILEWIKAEQQK